MDLDIPSLLVVNTLLQTVAALCLSMAALSLPRQAGLTYWAASGFAQAAGLALTNQLDWLPPWLTLLSSHFLIFTGYGLAYIGVVRFLGRPAHDAWPMLAVGVLLAAMFLWFTVGAPESRGRILASSLFFAALSAAMAWHLVRHAERELRPATTVTAALYAAWALLALARAGWALVIDWQDTAQEPHAMKVATRLVIICVTTTVTNGYLWMISRRLDSELMQQARQDPLTGVANRRVMWAAGEMEVSRALRHHRALSLLMIDIDHFKVVNDRWGHGTGDALLVAVADCLARELRRSDILARVGGEEFLALLPETGLEDAWSVAERVRQQVAAISLDRPQGAVRCTVSIGIATLGPDGHVWEDLVTAADQALYRAKETGRNRTETLSVGPGILEAALPLAQPGWGA
ncbi:GGDEF domain-containing protein [Nitrospirillum sp. BR 11164]|uniref:GGDEF domain-containing protein n=1 Tax=Nitrospirillum sp. BR 11164 TaxID=3104324 RepID=UPI002AFF5526|nr:GGDEF domain-containing protein [Nitrospirillum sp. BR 11164]MEA1647512.1 GGDEF domain-containing protein [Nitrospirillum sp. BR 11164]